MATASQKMQMGVQALQGQEQISDIGSCFYNMSWLLFILVATVSQGKDLEILICILVCSAALCRPIRRVVTRSLLHPDGSAVSAVIGFFPQERK